MFNGPSSAADKTGMRLRFWLGLAAVLLIAAGSVVAALIVHANDDADFHAMQRGEAVRAARQAEAVAALSVNQLSSAAAFFRAEGRFSKHEFDVIARSLMQQGALSGTGFLQRVPDSARQRYERGHGVEIFERAPRGGLRRAVHHPVYFPLTYVVSKLESQQAIGFDLGADPERALFLKRARDTGEPVATPIIQLLLGGSGLNVYRAVYRDGVPTRTVAERRAALLGFSVGAFRIQDLAASAIDALPASDVVQLRVDRRPVLGPSGQLDDPARARIQVADRTWVLVIRDPDRPNVSLPLLLAVVGISLAALLGSLILVWSRNERMEELQRQASLDPLTGLKNRRRFEEELRTAMARGRRERTTGAVLMLDLDHFKQVNDSLGHLAGDRLIEEIAEVLRRRTRAGDVLARLGGDEFAIVLPRASATEARIAAEAIVAAIREHEPLHDDLEPITASVGVAMFGEDPRTSLESVVSEADTAMYAAKDSGRDGVRVFDPIAVRADAPEPSSQPPAAL
jgi:diguanylate cyclase (GGDEF)-like protein